MKLDKKQQNLIRTFAYYLLFAGFTFILNNFVPGDMCNPGLGISIIMLAPIVTIGLIFRNLYLLSKGQKEHLYSFLLHFILLIAAFIFINFY